MSIQYKQFFILSPKMNLILFILATLLKFFFNMLYFIRKKLNHEKPQRIPPPNNNLFKMSATLLAEKIRLREITSQELVEAYIQRIKQVNPILNAVIEDRFQEALEEAKICDKNIRNNEITIPELKKQKPLYGIPFTVKESCMLKGLSYTGGSYGRKGIKALENGEAVEILRNAGAIPLCVTNTPELCTGFDSYNHLFGRTCNPYDIRYTAGGSSGGEGALIGSGCSLIGLGSDISGSIRIPALFNGIFGHKPTAGIVSIKGHFPYEDNIKFKECLLIGPMTRYVEDLHLVMKILTATYNRDLYLDDPVDLKKLKVFYLEDFGSSMILVPTQKEIRTCIKEAVKHLKYCGSEIEEYPGTLIHYIEEILITILTLSEIPILLDPNDSKHEKQLLYELPKSLLGISQYTFGAIFLKILIYMNKILNYSNQQECNIQNQRQNFIDLLSNNSVFIFPTYPITAPIGNVIIFNPLGTIYCNIWNLFGFPATNVPMGITVDGLPIGLQVIAAPYQDRLCLAVAKELERSFGGWIPPYPTC
ncbi:fatty-acid amide hydrolase 2-B-like isoform X2 [Vespa mandarinia]|uniref:fatty-acid amide hydrolase 2-B-like isoform X2 n=1 Tax=Vespa mandarinia TaxID=7446 RepID=UPI0016162F39|nr:fatty-acid amide hydrolase 2-B-like isoform X2 [Vespa mandarinia]